MFGGPRVRRFDKDNDVIKIINKITLIHGLMQLHEKEVDINVVLRLVLSTNATAKTYGCLLPSLSKWIPNLLQLQIGYLVPERVLPAGCTLSSCGIRSSALKTT